MKFTLLYPEFKKKAVCFSYDDGLICDTRIMEVLSFYHFKGTFNLVPGKFGEKKERIDNAGITIDASHISLHDAKELYAGQEIANHSMTHPFLQDLEEEQTRLELLEAKEELEKSFPQKVEGFVYPYGSYSSVTLKALREQGYEYARTTRSTYSFSAPIDWLLWNPTIHHRDPKLFETLNDFINSNQELACFFLWGHGYEFLIDHNIGLLSNFCEEVSKHDDITVMTCLEIAKYQKAAAQVYYFGRQTNAFINPSDLDIYIEVNGKKIIVPAKGEYSYVEE